MKKNMLFVLSGIFLLSNALLAQSQYCQLPGRTPYATQQPGITNFSLNLVNRSSSNVENVSYVLVTTGLTDTLVMGKTYTVSITHSEDAFNFPGAKNNIRMYIDYNFDFDFTDPGETVISKDLVSSGVFTGTFTIPTSAVFIGPTGLRVTAKMSEEVGHTIPTPCDNPADPLGYHGEIEDYWVELQEAPAPPNTVGLKDGTIPLLNVKAFPNPAKEQLSLNVTLSQPTKLTAELYSLAGEKVISLMNGKEMQTSEELTFNIAKVVPGIYFVKITSALQSTFQKVVITD